MLVLLASGLALWKLGIEALDMVALVLGLAGVVLVALCSLCVGVTGLWLRNRLRPTSGTPRQIEAGSPCVTGFRAPSLSWLPLVQLSWTWEIPRDVSVGCKREGLTLVEVAIARSRGHVPHIVRRLRVNDVFGLTRVSWSLREEASVTILPSIGKLRRMPTLRSLHGGEDLPLPDGTPEGDRIEIRRYAPGDPARNILWKTYAKTRQLNVRTPERAIAKSRKTIAYLVTGPGDEPAAAAARMAIESGALGPDWIFGADGVPEAVTDAPRALLAIALSGNGGGRPGLVTFLDQVGLSGRAHCVVFAPARTGPWVSQADACPQRLSFVLATDGYETSPRGRSPLAFLRTVMFTQEARPGAKAEDLRRLIARLARLLAPSADMVLLDRRTGRSHTGLGFPGAASRPAA